MCNAVCPIYTQSVKHQAKVRVRKNSDRIPSRDFVFRAATEGLIGEFAAHQLQCMNGWRT
jgi:hypothetical protein